MAPDASSWRRGRLDGGRGSRRLLFGRMHEDVSIELAAFRPGGRVFCIASAGCTALALSTRHDVVAADVNPVQIAYASRRLAGEGVRMGDADRLVALARVLAPLAGWSRSRVRDFLLLSDPGEQISYWKSRLDTRRFRGALDALLSRGLLRAFYAADLLAAIPARFGSVLRARLERGFGRHSNRENPYARALFSGGTAALPSTPDPARIRFIVADAADALEREPPESLDGFALSNILDGASEAYGRRLFAAVRRAAAPGSVVVLRSFAEPDAPGAWNRAAEDRSMLWGVVDVRPVETP